MSIMYKKTRIVNLKYNILLFLPHFSVLRIQNTKDRFLLRTNISISLIPTSGWCENKPGNHIGFIDWKHLTFGIKKSIFLSNGFTTQERRGIEKW